MEEKMKDKSSMPGEPAGSASHAPSASASTQCRKCRRAIGADDAYCRHCGSRQGQSTNWIYRPYSLIVLAFVFIGPFAIPLVMRSPFLTRRGKIILNTVIGLYTIFTFYILYRLFTGVFGYWQEIRDELGIADFYC